MTFLQDILRASYDLDSYSLDNHGLDNAVLSPIRRGTMNQCYRVEAGRTILFLKSYATRFYQPDQIRRACEVQMLTRRAGLPAPRIILNKQGDAVTVTEDGFYVLSEFVTGREYVRGEIPGGTAYQMGTTLSGLQHFLKGLEEAVPMELPDPVVGAARLRKLLVCAEARQKEAESERAEGTEIADVDAVACRLLRYKIEALHRNATIFTNLQGLPAQWVHGDYQVSNLVFNAAGPVAAILDFDQLQQRPRGLEMMRALAFSFTEAQVMEQSGLSFFRGYAEALSLAGGGLPEDEVRHFAPLWTYYWLVRPWPLDIRYEKPGDYDTRWDTLIQPPTDWWERNQDQVTEQFLTVLRTVPAST